MEVSFATDQEKFWAGEFGNDYVNRNDSTKLIASSTNLFAKIFSKCDNISSVIEFGCNIGLNLNAIKALLPTAEISAIEINSKAVEQLESESNFKIYNDSIIDFELDYSRDFVFTKGVLIHINPELLTKVYENLYRSSNKYIAIIEYYNPSPVAISYRGHKDKLFKRDFAGEIMDYFKDLKLVDYGFIYHRDKQFPQDDMNWFLMEKS